MEGLQQLLLLFSAAVTCCCNEQSSHALGRSQHQLTTLSNDSSVVVKETTSLSRLLLTVVQQEMTYCDLLLAYDSRYDLPGLFNDLLRLPNARQVMQVRGTDDLLGIGWSSRACYGYIFLLEDPASILRFTDILHDLWHYQGRYFFVGLSLEDLEALTSSNKGRKTEHLIGAVKSARVGEWILYTNQLYWGPGVVPVTWWTGHRLTWEVKLFPDKLSDLRGAKMKVLTFVWEPSIFYHLSGEGVLLSRYGVDIEMTNTLAKILNFSVQYEEPPNGERWGRIMPNGSFSGLLGRINRSEADFGVANLYLPQRQVNIIDYSAPYDMESSCFLVRSELPLPRWQALAFPFHPWTWLAILSLLLASGPILSLFSRSNLKEDEPKLESLSFSFYSTFGMHLSEPLSHLPSSLATRTLVLTLWLYCMVLTIAYSTKLTAYLVVSRQPKAIQTIEDLAKSGLTVVEIGTFYEHQLASASDPNLQALSRRFDRYKTPEEIFPLVLQGKVAYLHNRGYEEFVKETRFTSRGVARVRIMKECFAPYGIVMGLQRHSPLKRTFDKRIGWIQQSGIVKKFFKDSLRRASSTKEYRSQVGDPQGEEGAVPLSLDHLQGIFMVLVVLWMACIIVIILEKAIK